MSFSGNLEHLPIVDIIQLLHASRKTGTLVIDSAKGESQLVFHDGYFVGANHMNNSVRIGQVLVQMNALTQANLDQALQEQKLAGADRKPLVATLIEHDLLDRDTAYRGLESLIEMTIVEVLTWVSGSFTFDVSRIDVCDEYRYFPDKLHHEILINAQAVLMDALRIYDEKMRDGTLSTLFFPSENDGEQQATGELPTDITADLLGLDVVDNISRKLPDVFAALKEHNPTAELAKQLSELLPGVSDDQRNKLADYLSGATAPPEIGARVNAAAIIVLTTDEALSFAITSMGRLCNLFAFATDDSMSLDMIIEQSLGRDLHPLLLIDVAHGGPSAEALMLLQETQQRYPQISTMLSSCCATWQEISLAAAAAGARTILPRPCQACHQQDYIDNMITFLTAVSSLLTVLPAKPYLQIEHEFLTAVKQLQNQASPPEVAQTALVFCSTMFERVITFVVAKNELIAEKSIGVTSDRNAPPAAPLMFRVPLDEPSIFSDAHRKGHLVYGQKSDQLMTRLVHKEIGAPHSPKFLLAPLMSRGKVIAFIYGDFGNNAVTAPQTDLIEALMRHASLVLDNSLYRKQIELPV